MADSDDENGDDGAPVKNLVARCTELKAVGNEHFKAGRCDEAVIEYQKAVDKLTSAPAKKALAEFFKASPDSPDAATPLLSSLHGNMAACHVKASQWESAIRAASEALKLEPDNLKARFRRGVACSHVGQHAEAKADLTAVARADPTNREARRLLEGVNTALKQQRSSERAMFGKAFEGIRKEEESKAAAEAAAEAERKAAAEAAELRAWREECNALRDRVAGPKPTTDRLRLQAREGGAAGEAAQKELDRLAPISLKDFREARRKALAKAAAEEQAAREEELAARQRAEAQSRGARSDVTSLGADGDGDADMEALLRGLNKGYKTRADGSKTSYFDRSDLLDEKTKALLAAQKAPKRIDAASRTPPTAATTTAATTATAAASRVARLFAKRRRVVSRKQPRRALSIRKVLHRPVGAHDHEASRVVHGMIPDLERAQAAAEFLRRVLVAESQQRLRRRGFVLVHVLIQRQLVSKRAEVSHHVVAGVERHGTERHGARGRRLGARRGRGRRVNRRRRGRRGGVGGRARGRGRRRDVRRRRGGRGHRRSAR